MQSGHAGNNYAGTCFLCGPFGWFAADDEHFKVCYHCMFWGPSARMLAQDYIIDTNEVLIAQAFKLFDLLPRRSTCCTCVAAGSTPQ